MAEMVSVQLAESMLEAAESMQMLQDELDRISLCHFESGDSATSAASSPATHTRSDREVRASRRSHKKRKKRSTRHRAADSSHSSSGNIASKAVTSESEALSDHPASLSSSSRFDSAFDSLHSQTDDSLSSQPSTPFHSYSFFRSNSPETESRATHVHTNHTSIPDAARSPMLAPATSVLSYATPAVSQIELSSLRSRVCEHQRELMIAETIPVPVGHHSPPQLQAVRTAADVNTSASSTPPLFHELLEASRTHTIHQTQTNFMRVQGEMVELRPKDHKPKVIHHRKLTVEDAKKHMEWLHIAHTAPPSEIPEVDVSLPREIDETDMHSSSSCSTVVEEAGAKFVTEVEIHDDTKVVQDKKSPAKYGSSWVKVESPGLKHKSLGKLWEREPKLESKPSRFQPKHSAAAKPTPTQFYQDNLTPQPSPLVPRRYQPTLQSHMPQRYRTNTSHPQNLLEEEPKSRQPPKRSASILQRLRRRHGSFRRYGRPKQRIPVRRSFSDRFVYHMKKKWVDHEEDLFPVSNPSLLRSVGRLLRTHAGKLHIIELHKPPDGHFGIYITQGNGRKIFVSRFASTTAEKFYAGLITPGDEIVSINGQNVENKSLDGVYDILSHLMSVVLAVVPVSAHRNW